MVALRMFYPQGACASALAAARADTICVASSSAHNSLEEIAAAADGPKWIQVYIPREREIARRLVVRAERAGCDALVVTVDLGERKDADLQNNFSVSRDILLKHLRDIGHTHLNECHSHEQLIAFNNTAWDLSLNMGFFKWLLSQTQLPIILKGVLDPRRHGRLSTGWHARIN